MANGSDSSSPLGDEPLLQAIPAGPTRPMAGKLSAEDLIALNEEIAGMARAGLPLDQGLAELAREMGRGRLQQVTRQLADDLRAGLTLPQALERQNGQVPPYYAALLAAGIRSGRVSDVLGTLTLYARSLADFRGALVSALVYPAIVMVLGLGILAFVGIAILPGFVDVFRQMRLNLPPITRFLVFVGEHPLWTLVLPITLLILVPIVVRFTLLSGASGKAKWARFVYALPLVGTLLRSARLAAFTDLLGILVDQSIPLPEALHLAAQASSDPLLTHGAERLEQELSQGQPLGEALRRQRLVPDLVSWMILFGEKQGTLGSALHQVAQMYRRQADGRAALLRSVLPPLLILCLAGVLVTLFIFGLLAPMSSLLEGLGGVGGGRRR